MNDKRLARCPFLCNFFRNENKRKIIQNRYGKNKVVNFTQAIGTLYFTQGGGGSIIFAQSEAMFPSAS